MSRQHIIQTKKAIAPPQTQSNAIARSSLHPIEEMQALYGNRAVNQLLASQPTLQAKPMFRGLSGELRSPMQEKGGQMSTVLQAKLEIGAVGDKYEQDGERQPSQELDQHKAPASGQSHQGQSIQRQESMNEKLQEKKQQRQNETETPNQTGLPDALKAGVENLSGYSLDRVRVHYNSPKPAQLQAVAYTKGTEIHVAPGQEKHLPHEAWHVVQQMQGRVKPTMQYKELELNKDESLEKEADDMGTKAMLRHLTEKDNRERERDLQMHIIRQNDNEERIVQDRICQCRWYEEKRVPYDDKTTRFVRAQRLRDKNYAPEVNYASIEEGQYQDVKPSAGDKRHSEMLVLRNAMNSRGLMNVESVDDPLNLLREYKKMGSEGRRSKVTLYTERHPCHSAKGGIGRYDGCDLVLDVALSKGDIVYYSVQSEELLAREIEKHLRGK